jgi:hypothetical protein
MERKTMNLILVISNIYKEITIEILLNIFYLKIINAFLFY